MLKVYILDTNFLYDNNFFDKIISLISQERRDIAQLFHCCKDRYLSLGAGYLLNVWLTQKGVYNAHIMQDENGKPFIENYPDLYFNISHSGHFAILATSDYPVGVDIEEVVGDRLDIAEHFFTAKERKFVFDASSESESEDRFFRIWTLKESFMKATGIGCMLDLQDFTVNISHEQDICVSQNVSNEHFSFFEFEAPDRYKLSACVCSKYEERKRELIYIN